MSAPSASGGLGGVTPGSKQYQSFQTLNDLYGYSPMDMTHRITFYHDYQFPFGRGRKFLGRPNGRGRQDPRRNRRRLGICGHLDFPHRHAAHIREFPHRPRGFRRRCPRRQQRCWRPLGQHQRKPERSSQPSNWNGNPNSLLTATNLTNIGTLGQRPRQRDGPGRSTNLDSAPRSR